MAGFFKQLDRHRRRLPKELEQYDDEYLRYCVEKNLVETVLESVKATLILDHSDTEKVYH